LLDWIKSEDIFLWHEHKETQGQIHPIHLANWPIVTTGKQMGGLEIRDVEKK
jgi:hypothetical protein